MGVGIPHYLQSIGYTNRKLALLKAIALAFGLWDIEKKVFQK